MIGLEQRLVSSWTTDRARQTLINTRSQSNTTLLVFSIEWVTRIASREKKQQLTWLCDIELKTWAAVLDLDSMEKTKHGLLGEGEVWHSVNPSACDVLPRNMCQEMTILYGFRLSTFYFVPAKTSVLMIAVNYWTKVNHWGCNWMQSTNQNSETRGKPRLILLCLVLYLPRQNLCTKSVQWSDCPVSSQEHCSTKPNQLNTFDTEQSIKSFSNELRDMLML